MKGLINTVARLVLCCLVGLFLPRPASAVDTLTMSDIQAVQSTDNPIPQEFIIAAMENQLVPAPTVGLMLQPDPCDTSDMRNWPPSAFDDFDWMDNYPFDPAACPGIHALDVGCLNILRNDYNDAIGQAIKAYIAGVCACLSQYGNCQPCIQTCIEGKLQLYQGRVDTAKWTVTDSLASGHCCSVPD